MQVELRRNLAHLVGEGDPAFSDWLAEHDGHVFRLKLIRGEAYFQGLGPEAVACREPINVTSRAPLPFRLISNFAATPFTLDGRDYGSVEAFWQSLKFPDDERRREIAPLHGPKPKDLAFHAPASDVIAYEGQTIRVGTWDHWQLMERACSAKFEQHAGARDALLATGQRPIVHEMKRDSRTIPGAIMAQIWMRCRARLLK